MKEKKNFGYINYPPRGCGFFGNYFVVLSMIMTCHQRKLKPYVNLNKTAFAEGYNLKEGAPVNAENPWNWWFDQEIPSEDDNIIPIKFDTGGHFSHSTRFWKRNDIPYMRNIVDTYIHIKPHILKQVDEYYDEYLKNHIILGVMARGLEMNIIHPEYGNQTIETWINSTKNILNKYSETDLIFLMTEDSNYIPIYLKEFPNTFYLKNVYRRTTEKLEDFIKFPPLYCIVNTRKNHSRLLGEECLIQALLLSKCNYLLIKQCGTSSAAILFANNNLKNVFYV
jgi:hypothetical protein